MTTPAGLLLAAGSGSRFGGPKALLRYGDELFVERGVRTLREGGCDPIVIVLGAAATDVQDRADLTGAVVVVNDVWQRGLGSSLSAGLSALSSTAAPAAVVTLADQPAITSDAVRRVIAAADNGAAAVTATYHGRPGHPVLLAASVWSDVLATASGDAGARAWLQAHSDRVNRVACEDIADDSDIDTPADLERLLTRRP